MKTTTLNGKEFYNLLLGGYNNLQKNKDYVDALNVFPIPDGDTGKNMLATFFGGINGAKDFNDLTEIAVNFSKRALFSARGNSGVILSQFIKGICNFIIDNNLTQLTPLDFAKSLEYGYKQAYKSVICAVEGTMLTVMRESSQKLDEKIATCNCFEDLFETLIIATKNSLDNTPNLLAVLKEAGVVDSGGMGIFCIFSGMKQALNFGDNLSLDESFKESPTTLQYSGYLNADGVMQFGYCTELILQLTKNKTPFDKNAFIEFLQSVGDSVALVCSDDIVKVHVHTFTPEKVFAFSHSYGEFLNIKVENMDLQHGEMKNATKVESPKEKVKYAVVTVASGEGIADYFSQIGASVIINGGQTQNPSSQDFIKAFDSVSAENIIVLPNNSNIIMTAKQSKEIYDKCNVFVIETKSIAEGYSALSMIDFSSENVFDLIAQMQSNLENVTTGYIAKSNRNAKINGVTVTSGDYIAITDDTITYSSKDKNQAVLNLLENLEDIENKQTIIVFVGQGVTENEKVALEDDLTRIYPLYDVAFIDGGQPIYEYILSIE